MKKILLILILSSQLMTNLNAENHQNLLALNESTIVKSKFYIVLKSLMILGKTVEHDDVVLNGATGYAFGIDFGYKIGNGFAVEYDFSYSSNKVTETIASVVEEARAKYYTSSLDLIYTHEVIEGLSLFGKFGYEYEWEKIPDFHIDGTDRGFLYGIGFDITMNESYEFVLEYEHSFIESPRGDSLYAGIMYSF